MASSLQFGTTRCINPFERRTIWFIGQFPTTTIRYSLPRGICHAFGREGRHHCDSNRPGVSIRSNDLIQRADLKTKYAIFHAFQPESYHHCYSERPDVPSCRRANDTIWFIRQIWRTTTKESLHRLISNAFGSEVRRRCHPERPGVPIRWFVGTVFKIRRDFVGTVFKILSDFVGTFYEWYMTQVLKNKN